ncbi:hypothetical protein LJB91_03370 [Bacteroidales bacterium OttesenSCG-928-L03]|nr:hypothetical protein [Bacteroidales bacterium OttesenSCG-928-L03]
MRIFFYLDAHEGLPLMRILLLLPYRQVNALNKGLPIRGLSPVYCEMRLVPRHL